MRTYSPGAYVDTARNFPRVDVPGVDRDAVDALTAERDFRRRRRMSFVLAFMARGIVPARPISGDERKSRRAAGKRQRAGRRAVR